MEELKMDIQQVLASIDESFSFEELMERFCSVLASHPEALSALEGRYRLQTTDTGVHVGFALSASGFQALDASEPVDAVISGKEENLLQILRRELNPMAAMFTGKLSVKGSMQALMKFSQVL